MSDNDRTVATPKTSLAGKDRPEEDWGDPAGEGAAYSANHTRRPLKTEAERGQGKNLGPAVAFHFNPTGADRFYDLTSKNRPVSESGFHRQLAASSRTPMTRRAHP